VIVTRELVRAHGSTTIFRRAAILAATLAALLTATTAFAAPVAITSKHLTAGSLVVPVFYPNSLVTANVGGTLHKPSVNDTITVVFSAEILASTICTGAPTQFATLSVPLTVTITSNTAPSGNDLLSIPSVGTGVCAVDGIVHFGTIDLGSTGYVPSGTATFSNSTFALTQTATSGTIVITLGTASGTATAVVATGTSAIYAPDTALTDTAGNPIRLSTALSTATVQF
jgi:hypothetical protein